ncbi:hypothetical protein Y022_03695 [Streptococcus thermophilus TH1477]|nr:hypothetical protein Y022_03695 [Streptococcus thermophilus TH1477]
MRQAPFFYKQFSEVIGSATDSFFLYPSLM